MSRPSACNLHRHDRIALILHYLQSHGGVAQARAVQDWVGHLCREVFTEFERSPINSGRIERWRNQLQWARQDLVDQGLLQRPIECGQGIWALSEAGRALPPQAIPDLSPGRGSSSAVFDDSGPPAVLGSRPRAAGMGSVDAVLAALGEPSAGPDARQANPAGGAVVEAMEQLLLRIGATAPSVGSPAVATPSPGTARTQPTTRAVGQAPLGPRPSGGPVAIDFARLQALLQLWKDKVAGHRSEIITGPERSVILSTILLTGWHAVARGGLDPVRVGFVVHQALLVVLDTPEGVLLQESDAGGLFQRLAQVWRARLMEVTTDEARLLQAAVHRAVRQIDRRLPEVETWQELPVACEGLVPIPVDWEAPDDADLMELLDPNDPGDLVEPSPLALRAITRAPTLVWHGAWGWSLLWRKPDGKGLLFSVRKLAETPVDVENVAPKCRPLRLATMSPAARGAMEQLKALLLAAQRAKAAA
jgi:hypothetical protein